jgi:hypothetical protein
MAHRIPALEGRRSPQSSYTIVYNDPLDQRTLG